MVYATSTDYTDVMGGTAPDGIDRTLTVASRRVDEMLLCAVYAVDSSGLPTDSDVAAALKLATVEQAAHMRRVGDADGTATAGQFQSFTIGGLSATRGATGSGAGSSGVPRHSPEAFAVLQQAGLTGQSPLVP